MKFISTRGECPPLGFSDAVEAGLAPDGGLYLPETLPDIGDRLASWSNLDYPGLCAAFLGLFADDIPVETLTSLVKCSYQRFTHPDIAPLVTLDEQTHVLELFHGPTLAFKDFALQILGNLYEQQIARTGRTISVLGATSGDTGSAAIHGLLGKEGVTLFILYPEGRISPLQECQMTTTGAPNVFPLAIAGSFDDAQHVVKGLFGDLPFKEKWHLSAINSINLARILAQCVYYVWAWLRLPADARQAVEFIVPTGNFGNILAGWLTARMGLPGVSFRVATNQNDILYRLFTTGNYAVDQVKPSLAPSMDIQVASNFERFLYYSVDGDSARVRQLMKTMRETGHVTFDNLGQAGFAASRSTDADINRLIREVHQRYDYIVDPHTACAFQDPATDKTRVMLATAHPAKFPDVIREAIGIHPRSEALDALIKLPRVNYPLPAEEASVRAFIEKNARPSSSHHPG